MSGGITDAFLHRYPLLHLSALEVMKNPAFWVVLSLNEMLLPTDYGSTINLQLSGRTNPKLMAMDLSVNNIVTEDTMHTYKNPV